MRIQALGAWRTVGGSRKSALVIRPRLDEQTAAEKQFVATQPGPERRPERLEPGGAPRSGQTQPDTTAPPPASRWMRTSRSSFPLSRVKPGIASQGSVVPP